MGKLAQIAGLVVIFSTFNAGIGLAQGSNSQTQMDERSLFYLPQDTDFRTQWIEKKPGEINWPFTEVAGCLTCAWLMGAPAVYFVPDTPEYRDDEATDFPVLILSVNPLEILMSNADYAGQFVPMATIEEKIKRLAPFVAMGHALCNQPRGGQVGPAEL
ncbi:MAG: hypothetical protein ACRCT6_05400 [Notoacmeibacter sp.]